jgi:hypothetical protein
MDGLSDLLPLLQGASSPALVVLAVVAWNLYKAVKELADAVHDVDTRLAVIEDRLGVEHAAPRRIRPRA